MAAYHRAFEIRWADLDPNRHLRHTAYNDFATHVRFSYLKEHGFGPAEFTAYDFGPVITREETRFFREVGMTDTVTIDFKLQALSPAADRFRMSHDVTRSDGVLAARIVVDGVWLNLTTRKPMAPPPELAEMMRTMARTDDYQDLPGRP